MLRNHKHARIETNTSRGWFSHSFREQLIHFLLNGIMGCSFLDIELPEVMEQGRTGPKLKMVTPNHVKHKPDRCNAIPYSDILLLFQIQEYNFKCVRPKMALLTYTEMAWVIASPSYLFHILILF